MVATMPNFEAVLSAFLRSRSELDALDDRIYTALPKAVTYPAMRVSQIGDLKVTSPPLWVVTASIQVEAWGGTKAEAFDAANIAQALISDELEGVHDGAVINGARISSLRDLPDETFTPAKPRWLFVAEVTGHPR